MALMHRDHDGGILAALALVNRDRVRESQFVERREIIFGVILVEHDTRPPARGIDRYDPADLAVEDQLVVIVAQLDDAIAFTHSTIARAQLAPTRIQQLLQLAIQRLRAE